MPANHFPSTGYVRPPCPSCGELMMLSRIDRETTEHDRRTFECFPCNRSERVIVTLAA
jgi:predicted RNA-binding Zn-ribbon protein involved in translation (DUF1610 family)